MIIYTLTELSEHHHNLILKEDNCCGCQSSQMVLQAFWPNTSLDAAVKSPHLTGRLYIVEIIGQSLARAYRFIKVKMFFFHFLTRDPKMIQAWEKYDMEEFSSAHTEGVHVREDWEGC